MALSDRDVERIADAVICRIEDMAQYAEIAHFVIQFLKEEDKQRILQAVNREPKAPIAACPDNPPPEPPAEP